MKFASVILARVMSTRLKRKVLMDLEGVPLLAHVIKRSSMFPGVADGGKVVMAIPERSDDDELVELGEKFGVKVIRGSEDDVLSRLIKAGESVEADVVYRVTGDNPLVDPGVVENTWAEFTKGEWDYSVMENTPLGTTAEIVTVDALKRARKIANGSRLREHPTLTLYENSDKFKMLLVPAPEKWRHPEWRFTVDQESDFHLVERIMSKLGADATLETIVPFLENHPEIAAMNSDVSQQGWESLKERKNAIGGV